MMLRRTVYTRLAKRLIHTRIAKFKPNPYFINSQQQATVYLSDNQMALKYFFSTQSTPNSPKGPVQEHVITSFIEQAKNTEELHSIINSYHQRLNFIHRTVLLQKVTQKPFDKDEQLVSRIIQQIKDHWNSDFAVLSEINSRAVANIICYMSRKTKFHDLDQQFSQIDFYELAANLKNPKEFIMMINGLLKLELLDKIIQKRIHFKFQQFLTQTVDAKFTPSLLVSMWFNIIKYQKSSPTLNDLFANLLKNKHFKNNLIDYMQIVYCYVKSEGKRTVDLIYPVLTHPKEVRDGKGYLGAHELSVLYQQLGSLKKTKDVYFSEEFNMLLQTCFMRILTEKDIPLRNVANVFVNLTSWENPTSKVLDSVYHKYFTVLKHQMTIVQSFQRNKKIKPNVDPLSFVTLFEFLIQYYHAQNRYLKEMTEISLKYVQKIFERRIISEYNEKTFVRLLSVIEFAKKTMYERNHENLVLKDDLKGKFAQQIMRRSYNEVASLGKLIGFVYNMEIRQKRACEMFKKMIKLIPSQNQAYASYQKRLIQPCLLNKNCSHCLNCVL